MISWYVYETLKHDLHRDSSWWTINKFVWLLGQYTTPSSLSTNELHGRMVLGSPSKVPPKVRMPVVHKWWNAHKCVKEDETKKLRKSGCRRSSVDYSAPTILPPWLRVPITPFTLLSFIVKFVLYFFVKRTKINKKRRGFAHFLKKIRLLEIGHLKGTKSSWNWALNDS